MREKLCMRKTHDSLRVRDRVRVRVRDRVRVRVRDRVRLVQ